MRVAGFFFGLCFMGMAFGQIPSVPPALAGNPSPFASPSIEDRTYPLSLAEALRLAGSRPLDILIAGQQVEAAAKRYDLARALWVPNLVVGGDYFRHEGGQQNFVGDIVRSSRGNLAAGVGPNIVFSFSDALFAPKVAVQDLAARRAGQSATTNDVTAAVAEAYFTVQQARGELAGADLALRQAEELSRRATALGEGLSPPLEATRARVEKARRKQAVSAAKERWRIASAELARLIRLDPTVLVEPVEPPFLSVTLIDESATLDSLVPIALQNRPELAAHQAIVQAALARLRQEKLRPLLPSLAVRSTATNPSGSIAYAAFGGGTGSRVGDATPRFDLDVQLLWEFSNLGFGNKARTGEKRAEHFAATLELFRTQDRIAAEVATEFARVKAAAERKSEAEPALKDAVDLVEKSLIGLAQTRRIGDTITLVVRPQEVVAAVQSLGQSTVDYAAAVADFNRAQFRLYRALGHPAFALPNAVPQFELPPAPAALQIKP